MTQLERKTFFLHLLFSLLNGMTFGIVFSLYEVVAKRALGASDLEITVLVMGLPVAWLFSTAIASLMQRHESYRPFLLGAGATRIISMTLMLWVKNSGEYLALMILFLLPISVINPVQNFILARNYPSASRGRWFGWANSVANVSALLTSITVGMLLDANEQLFREVYFIIGLAGGLACFVLAAIPTPRRKTTEPLENPVKKLIAVLAKNKGFRIFERNFFIYGSAFLILSPVIPVYLVDALKMSYTEVSFARAVIGMFGVALFSPFVGRFHDRYNPFRFAAAVFGMLALFPLLLALGCIFGHASVYAAYVLYSFAMAGIAIVWNLGSIYFAEPDREALYQSIHVTLTGVRGIIAPVLGYVAMHFLGYWFAFLVSSMLFFASSYLMSRSARTV